MSYLAVLNPFIKSMMVEVFLAISSMFLLIVGAVRSNKNEALINRLLIIVLILALFLIAFIPNNTEAISYYKNFFKSNEFIDFTKILLIGATALLLIINQDNNDSKNFEFPILTVLSLIGMLLMVAANDFLSLYMGLELQSLSLYVLAAYDRDNSKSAEAGLKYFVLGALASGIMLYGISLIYGFTGTTNFANLSGILGKGNELPIAVLVGLIMVMIAFCFKLSAAPFHMWTPDVYEGAPMTVTAFFAMVPKIAAVILLGRILLDTFGLWFGSWQQVIILVSVLSMLTGALGAIRQTNIKRLLAYSSIGHVGYILMGIASGNEIGMQAILVYLLIYVIMNAGVFSCIMQIRRSDDTIDENINSYAGLAKKNPMFALTLAILMFSMAGIPPMAGFFAKFHIFVASINANLYSLTIIAVIASVISAYYYLKIVKIMYIDEAKEEGITAKNVTFVGLASLLFNLLYILFSEGFLTAALNAARSIFS